MSKPELLDNLRGLLRDALKLRSEGAAYAKLTRAQGYIDGYMRVLMDMGVADQRSLLALVSEERRRADGPATAELSGAEDAAPQKRSAAA